MLKKTVTYVDYDGNEQTEDLWFNLSKTEVAKMELSSTGGLEKLLKNMVEERDNERLCALFDNLILQSYGKKSLDGRRFIKSQELREEFSQSAAYDTLFMELITNGQEAAMFVTGIIPADMLPKDKTKEELVNEAMKALPEA